MHLIRIDGAHDDIWVELDDMVVPEVLHQPVPEQSVGVIDEDAVLVLLPRGREIRLFLFSHYNYKFHNHAANYVDKPSVISWDT